MATFSKPLLSQAEYIHKCLALCAKNPWLAEYHQTPAAQQPGMLQALTRRIETTTALAATRTSDLLKFAAEQQEPKSFWREMTSRSRHAYKNEVKSVEILTKKENEMARTFENTAYLLTDEISEVWKEFCVVKATYAYSLQRQLQAAQKTVKELRTLCEERGTSTKGTRKLVRLHQQQNKSLKKAGDVSKTKRQVSNRKRRIRIRKLSAQTTRKRTFRQWLAGGVLFTSGFICGIIGACAAAWRTARG